MLLILLPFSLMILITDAATPDDQRKALEDFYDSSRMSSVSTCTRGWASGDPCENEWEGLTCDLDGNIVSISLPRCDLDGSLPVSLSALSGLAELDLTSNYLYRNIPSEFSRLQMLSTLRLSSNKLIGNVDAGFSQLTNLVSLSLSSNSLSGPFPEFFKSMTRISTLDLLPNSFTDCKCFHLFYYINTNQ